MMVPMPEPSERDASSHGDVDRLRSRDPLAFHAFVVKHQRAVFALLSRMLGRGAHVEDLAQETFLRAHRALPTFDPNGPAKVSTWLLTIATRLALDERKRRRPEIVADADPEAAPAQGTPFHDRQRSELRSALEAAARALPDDQCAALVLSEVQGLTLAEIAMVLGVPEGTVKTKVFRAREKMKDSLRAWNPTNGSEP